jgi:SAM-dependent methyltransferase
VIECILRNKSVITQKSNLEHLHTIKDFPVFFGCSTEPPEKDLVADMVWKIDPETGLIQLSELIPLDILYMEQHVDATGEVWENHNNSFAEYVLKNRKGNIIEIGGGSGKIANIILDNDDSIQYTAIEPNPLFEERKNLRIIKSFFSRDFKDQFDDNNTIVFSQLYEHVYDPEEFLNEIRQFLPVGGRLIFAYPNLEYWFKNKFTNAINFEHTMLMTDYYVDYFLARAGFKIVEKYEYKNHSHFYVSEKLESRNTDAKIENRYEHYSKMFAEFIDYHQTVVDKINNQIENNDSKVFLFGGHIFSQYLIMMGLNISKIINILDNSPAKQEKRLYGTDLTVKSPEILKDIESPLVILKAGLYNDEIKKDILENINPDTVFI